MRCIVKRLTASQRVCDGRADDDVDTLDSLEINEALVRLAVLYGPGYVYCLDSEANAYLTVPVLILQSVVFKLYGANCACRRYCGPYHGSHRDRFVDFATLEDDDGFAHALFQFLEFVYDHRDTSKPTLAALPPPKMKALLSPKK